MHQGADKGMTTIAADESVIVRKSGDHVVVTARHRNTGRERSLGRFPAHIDAESLPMSAVIRAKIRAWQERHHAAVAGSIPPHQAALVDLALGLVRTWSRQGVLPSAMVREMRQTMATVDRRARRRRQPADEPLVILDDVA